MEGGDGKLHTPLKNEHSHISEWLVLVKKLFWLIVLYIFWIDYKLKFSSKNQKTFLNF